MLEIDVLATRKRVQRTLNDYINVQKYLINKVDSDFYSKYPSTDFGNEMTVKYGINYDAKLLNYLDQVTKEKETFENKIKFQKDVLNAFASMDFKQAQFLYLFYVQKTSQNKTMDNLNIGRNRFYQLRKESERTFAILLGIEKYKK